MNLDLNTILEVLGVTFNLLYLILLIKEQIVCWIFGIIGSLVSIWLFYRMQLFSESILYVYYVIIGFYGYYTWNKRDKNNSVLAISEWKLPTHGVSLAVALIAGYGLGYYFDTYTEAQNAYFDAYTTVFSFLASYMEAKKILSSWYFWIVINGATIFLYSSRGLDIYSMLTIVYFLTSFIGYFNWRKKYSTQINNSVATI
ncbi:MAG: nicotinamide mononucleotide transporter [Salibacteraceae bacterium]